MKILVLAAHPDDEVLGCGGTLYKLAKDKNNQILLTFAANGVSGRKDHTSHEISQRKSGSLKVAKALGAKIINYKNGSYPFPFKDQNLDKADFNKVVRWAETIIKQYQPEVIYTHSTLDLNRDHQIVSEAVIVATRPNSVLVKEIYFFEIPESTEEGSNLQLGHFKPNVYEKIRKEEKIALFDLYHTEKNRSDKWERGINSLGLYRGFNAGYDFAEAFVLVRKRND